MEPFWAKVTSACILAAFTVISGLMPLWMSPSVKQPKPGRLLNVLLSFSGGVLFATCFLHLIPEVTRNFDKGLASYGAVATLLPWGELSVCIGFFVIYGVEELVEYLVCRSCERQHHHHDVVASGLLGDPKTATACLAPVHSVHGTHREAHDPRHCSEGRPEDETTPLLRSVRAGNPDGESVRDTLTGLLLVCALSFHSIFEGMAIGLQTTVADVWNSLLGIALHKFVLAFCVGVQLMSLRTKTLVFCVYVVTFALISPAGLAIGTAVTETGTDVQDSSLPLVSLQGLASGTLLYVTFFEILNKTKGTELASLLNFAALISGFALMAALHTLG